MVAVEDCRKIVKSIAGCGHQCFPVRSFSLLSVSTEDEHTSPAALHPHSERHACGNGKPMPKRTCVYLDSWHLVRWMPDQPGSWPAILSKLAFWEIAPLCKTCVIYFSCMALRKHESVPLRILRMLGICSQHAEEEGCHDVCR